MIRSVLMAGAVLLLAGTGTRAADIIEPADFDWTGFYAGAQIGYGWGKSDHAVGNTGLVGGDTRPDGVTGGIHAGYLYQAGRVVLGAEADIEMSDIGGDYNDLTDQLDSQGSTDIDWQASARLRLGYAIDRVLPYITGGLAWAPDAEFRNGPGDLPSPPDVGPCCGFDKDLIGWTIGAGLEYALADRWSLRLEYRYTDFGSEEGRLQPDFPNVKLKVDTDIHAVRGGVSWRF